MDDDQKQNSTGDNLETFHPGIQRRVFRRREDYEAHEEILAIRESSAARHAEMVSMQAEIGLLKLELERTRDVLMVLTTEGNSSVLRDLLEEMKQRRQRREAVRNRFVGMILLAPIAVAIAWAGRHLEDLGAWAVQWWESSR